MKICLYNDCFLEHRPHFGCELVRETFLDEFEKRGVEVLGTLKVNQRWDQHRALLDKADLVVVNGEGSLHHDRRNDLLEISRQYPSVLVNTVYQENTPNEHLKNFRYVSGREIRSVQEMRKYREDVHLVPDVIFLNKRLNVAKSIGEKIANVYHFSGIRTLQSADSFLSSVSECNRMNTESFHALIVAKLLGIKTMNVKTSNTWKNESYLESVAKMATEECQRRVGEMFDQICQI